MQPQHTAGQIEPQSRPPTCWSWRVAWLSLALFAAPTAPVLFRAYWSSPDFAHGFFVVAVATAAAIKILRESLDTLWTAPVSPRLGLALASAGILIVLTGRWYETALRQQGFAEAFSGALGLILILASVAHLYGGRVLLRRLAFPLVYLLCAVPWPTTVTTALTLALRTQVAGAAAAILRALGFLVYREGNLLHFPDFTLGVVDACSGLRSFWVLVALALALAWWLKLGLRRGLVLVFCALPASMAANLIRVVATAILATRVDVRLAEGIGHEAWGLAVFAFGTALITMAGWYLAACLQPKTVPAATLQAPGRACRRWPFWTLTLLLLLGSAATAAVERHYPYHLETLSERDVFSSFPRQLGAYKQLASGDILPGHLTALQADDRLVRVFQAPDGRIVHLWALYWTAVRSRWAMPAQGPHLPEICYPAAGWTHEKSMDAEPSLPGLPENIARLRVFHKPGKMQILLYWLQTNPPPGGHLPFAVWQRLRVLAGTWNTPVKIHQGRFIVAVETDAIDSLTAARSLLEDFSATIIPELAPYGLVSQPRHPQS